MLTEILVGILILVVAGLAVAVAVALSRMARPDASQDMAQLRTQIADLAGIQQLLAGKLEAVGEQQINTSKALTDTLASTRQSLTEELSVRLESVQRKVGDDLSTSAKETAKSLGELSQRLETIDKAQQNITNLSEQVVTLQHVLDDKHARGAFGEVQLNDLVTDVLPPSAYAFQYVLSNSRRADCLIKLPNPPGPIVVDAKFPLTAYSAMLDASDSAERTRLGRQLASDTKKHIKDIAERYIIVGETSDSALMFIPSEAVYAEIHANHPDVVELSHRLKVFMVSPTTMMATLTTVRAVLRDVRMREQAGLIQIEVGKMMKDVERLMERVRKLEGHFDLAQRDLKDIRISADKIAGRGGKIEELELHDPETQPAIEGGESLPFE